MIDNRQLKLAITGAVILLAFCAAGLANGCSRIPESKLEQGATDFCKARANYKVLAAAIGGALDPAPGSPRAALETQEDLFCVNVAAIVARAPLPSDAGALTPSDAGIRKPSDASTD